MQNKSITGGVVLHAPNNATISPILRIFGNAEGSFVFNDTKNLMLPPFDFSHKVKTGAFFVSHDVTPCILLTQRVATIYGTTIASNDTITPQALPSLLLNLKPVKNLRYRDLIKKNITDTVTEPFYSTLIYSKHGPRSNISVLGFNKPINWLLLTHKGCSVLVWTNEDKEVFENRIKEFSLGSKIDFICTTEVETSVSFLPLHLSSTWIRWYSAVRNLPNFDGILLENLKNFIFYQHIDTQ